jgi:hypothetical protein
MDLHLQRLSHSNQTPNHAANFRFSTLVPFARPTSFVLAKPRGAEFSLRTQERTMPAGYSGKSLREKLGVKTEQRTWRFQMPLSVAREIEESGCVPVLLETPQPGLEMAHLFVSQRRELLTHLPRLRQLLAPAGTIWVSWPKKSSRVETDLTDNVVRNEALALGLVDIKVCAVDAVWSGLKLVIRKSER